MNVTADKADKLTPDTTGPSRLRVSLGSASALRDNRYLWAVPLVLAVIAAGLLLVNHRHDTDHTDAPQAQKVVVGHVEQLLSYDYRTIDSQLATQRDWLTGDFQTKYADLLTTRVVPAAQQARLTTRASVVSSGIVSIGHHEVHLLVFLDVTSQRAGQAHPVQSGSRIAVTADDIDGTWRISAMDPV